MPGHSATLSPETIAFVTAFGDDRELVEMFGRPKPDRDELSAQELAEVALTLLKRAADVMERLTEVLDQAERSEKGGRNA